MGEVKPSVVVIIPALNEERAIGYVIKEIPEGLVDEVIVGNNGSSDRTEGSCDFRWCHSCHRNGTWLWKCLPQGNGSHFPTRTKPDIVVFLDGDHSDYPEEIPLLVKPISEGFDMVIGSRNLGGAERGSLTPQQVFGNWLATFLLRLIYGVKFSDLGPFRAIRYEALLALEMEDRNYGWTVEMQIKAAKQKMKTCEVSVRYRNRIGHSKVSGTIRGSVMAGYKIIKTLFKYI